VRQEVNVSEMNAQCIDSITAGDMELLTKQLETCVLREHHHQIKTCNLSMAHIFR